MIYMGEGAGGALAREKSRDVLGEPRNYVLKQDDSSELTLAFVIVTIIANNDGM